MSSLADLAPGPVTELAARERGELLRAGLARIPLDDQIALELAYFEGMSTRDIASVLEINANTVRSRLSRARDKLREVLADARDRRRSRARRIAARLGQSLGAAGPLWILAASSPDCLIERSASRSGPSHACTRQCASGPADPPHSATR